MDHDALFKRLLRTFFVEFLEAFVPELHAGLRTDFIEFLDKELILPMGGRGTRRVVDLVAKVQLRSEPGVILVHIEHQAQRRKDIAWRMLVYAIGLREIYGLPVYPILLSSYERPATAEPSLYQMSVHGRNVLQFRVLVIQLNRMSWRRFCRKPNPVATALMVRMRVKPRDRVRLKVQILRLFTQMRLDRRRMDLVAGFVDQYLVLKGHEKLAFQEEVRMIGNRRERGQVMKLMTQWEREGLVKGRAQGRAVGRVEGERAVVLRQIKCRFGCVPKSVEQEIGKLEVKRIEALAEALLDFKKVQDLAKWLRQSANN